MPITCPLLFVVRHGQTAFNKDRRFQGQAQVPLNSTGRIQAERSGKILANILSTNKVTLQTFSSDLMRARETAVIIKQVLEKEAHININYQETKALREFNVGLFENHTMSELEKNSPDMVNNYFNTYALNPKQTRYPGDLGESREMVADRLAPVVKMLEENIANYLLVSHGGTIDVLLELLEGTSDKEKEMLGNGDLLVLTQNQQDTEADLKKNITYNCTWKVLRHYQVGDNLAARSNYSTKKDTPA